jgi:Cyclic nucleotide-binding domain
MKSSKALRLLFGSNKQEKEPVNAPSDDAFEKPVEMLRDLPWLSLVDDEVFNKVLAGFESRQFQEGATLLKEKDPDNGMFVIVSGKVKIEIRGISMNELSSGSLIGEMSVLTGYPRSTSVVAVTPVSVLWIESTTLKSIMKKSPVLENGLWEFASRRFAMNLLGRKEPYNQWEQNIFIQWLAAGEIKVPNENGWIDLKNKVGVLVTGTASLQDGSAIISPASLVGSDYIFSKEARVFLRDK